MPKIDLHGEDRIGARILVRHFIEDNYKTGYDELAIIHGGGSGTLRKEVHEILKKDKRVIEYKLDNFNSGCTLVKINRKI